MSTPEHPWTPAPSGRAPGREEAYRFARGEEITAANGMRVKLARPLDFLVVADHSDNMGFFPKLFAGDPKILADPTGKRWYEMIQQGGGRRSRSRWRSSTRFSKGTFPPALASLPGTELYRSAWERTSGPPRANNEPGRFTAFIGYEWTSNTGGNNLHRVVVFRDGADKAGQVEPYTTIRRSAATTPRTCGRSSRPTRTRPAAASSPSRTTATSRTGSCSP